MIVLAALALAAVGAAAVAASSSSSRGRAPGPDLRSVTPLPGPGGGAPKDGWDLNTQGQKFADPWISLQFGPYGKLEGREYLRAVPANGTDRVKAMLSKVSGNGSTPVIGIDAIREAGSRIAAVTQKRETDTRDQVNLWITRVASVGGPAGLALANAYIWASKQIPLDGGAVGRARTIAEGAALAVQKGIEQVSAEGLPYPWHLPNWVDVAAANGDARLLDHLGETATCNARRMLALPDDARAATRAWWSLLAVEIARRAHTPDGVSVEAVFRAMHAGWWGGYGNFSSDEQALIVAAPFASAYRIPLRELAARLWDENGGWSASPALLRTPSGACGYLPPGEYGPGSGGSPRYAANATQVQFATLSALAAKIAGAK